MDLLLQVRDPLLFGGMVGWPFLLKGSSPVLEELLLPAVEDRWLESHFIAQLRNGLLLQQVPPQNGDLLFRRVVLPLLCPGSAGNGEEAFPVSCRFRPCGAGIFKA